MADFVRHEPVLRVLGHRSATGLPLFALVTATARTVGWPGMVDHNLLLISAQALSVEVESTNEDPPLPGIESA